MEETVMETARKGINRIELLLTRVKIIIIIIQTVVVVVVLSTYKSNIYIR